MNVLSQLRDCFAKVLAEITPDNTTELIDMVRVSQDARFGDYQANCAMPLAKQLGKPPRDVAADIVARLDIAEFCELPEIAGPGFINLRLRSDWIHRQLERKLIDTERLEVQPTAAPQTIVIDYSSPNVAKPMHVGHIRSTVIGAALENVLRFVGHRTISDNHIGDWGTQFGMILYGYKHFLDTAAYKSNSVAELSRLYRLVNSLVEYHDLKNIRRPELQRQLAVQETAVHELAERPEEADKKEKKKAAKELRQAETRLDELQDELNVADAKIKAVEQDDERRQLAQEHTDIDDRVLAETAALHAGDETNRKLWHEFLPACLEEIEQTYRRLGVRFDHALGESFYQDRLAGVVESLENKQIATDSAGAVCVFLEGYASPMIVRKKDGAFLYATTDLATIQYRMEAFQPDAMLYVVDHRQSLHFEQLFAVARLWGVEDVQLEHIKFGTVLGEDGRPYKTRTGDAVGLAGLLDEAVVRARAIVDANDDGKPSAELSDNQRQQVAEAVGIGAIKYADLNHNRESDYVFSYDKMLSTKGNTATYMQYSCARVRSIFARGEVDIEALRQSAGATIQIQHAAERALAIEILRFAEALDRVVADYRPNHLTAYLFELAGCFAEFFDQCPVLKAEDQEVRTSRLLLCDLTARTLRLGLSLLGIEVVEKM